MSIAEYGPGQVVHAARWRDRRPAGSVERDFGYNWKHSGMEGRNRVTYNAALDVLFAYNYRAAVVVVLAVGVGTDRAESLVGRWWENGPTNDLDALMGRCGVAFDPASLPGWA